MLFRLWVGFSIISSLNASCIFCACAFMLVVCPFCHHHLCFYGIRCTMSSLLCLQSCFSLQSCVSPSRHIQTVSVMRSFPIFLLLDTRFPHPSSFVVISCHCNLALNLCILYLHIFFKSWQFSLSLAMPPTLHVTFQYIFRCYILYHSVYVVS